MASFLNEIVARKWQEVAQARASVPIEALREQVAAAPPVRDFFGALAAPGPVRLIAEVKRASPSRGAIRPGADPVEIATTYEKHGASCISVLTDEAHFDGSFEDLRRVRAAVSLPVLCKDFIVDSYQLYQARAAGADAVLLIAECLDDARLKTLYTEAMRLGLMPLVELFEAANLARVLGAGATLVGINNRDLRTFNVDLEHTVRLCPLIPDECLVVGESGIRSRSDVERLGSVGVKAILVGEFLMASEDVGAAVDALLGR